MRGVKVILLWVKVFFGGVKVILGGVEVLLGGAKGYKTSIEEALGFVEAFTVEEDTPSV